MTYPRLASLLVLTLLPVAACGDDGPPGVAEECNPLGGVGCITPWPSAIYLRDDATSPTGVRLDLAPGAFPISADDIELDVSLFNDRTGFSPAAQIFTVFPEGVDDGNLVFHDAIGDSLEDGSPTVIVDMETGERVAHFAELDANAASMPEEQALYLRPAARLAGGRRYAVGIRKSLKNRDGGDLTVPDGFQAILDGKPSGHARLEAIRAGYDAVFTALDGAGVPRTDLVVAWDFTTADDDSVIADTGLARDAALAAMGSDGANLTYEITLDESPYPGDADIARRVLFSYQVPAVAGEDGLHRDGDGNPVVDGTSEAEAVAMIPACATAAQPAGILIFGHGFFGNLSEAQDGYMRRVARDLCMVVVGGVWRGMSSDDLSFAAAALNDGNKAVVFGERNIHGIVDFIALEQLARSKLAAEMFTDGNASIVDPAKTYFYGISQGSILGTTFMAWDPHLTRAALHVGGGNWGVLFERSTNWVTFKLILSGAYPGPLNAVIIQQVMQMGFDPTDPVHVARRLLDNRLPGTPVKQYLVHESVGDAQVSNLASELQARTIGLPLLGPALYVPYGLTEVTGPQQNAFVIMSEEPTPLPPDSNLTNDQANSAHGDLRRRAAVVDQLEQFFATGEIVHQCGGVACNCAEGACGPLDPP